MSRNVWSVVAVAVVLGAAVLVWLGARVALASRVGPHLLRACGVPHPARVFPRLP